MERIKFFHVSFFTPIPYPYTLSFFAPQKDGMLEISPQEIEEKLKKHLRKKDREIVVEFLRSRLYSQGAEEEDQFFHVPLINSVFEVDLRKPTIVILGDPYTVYSPEGNGALVAAVSNGERVRVPRKVSGWLKKCYSYVHPLNTALALEFVEAIEESKRHPLTTVTPDINVIFGNDDDEEYEDEDEDSESY